MPRHLERKTLVVQVSPQFEEKIEQLVASGHLADAGDVIDKAVQLLEERERKRERLRAELAIGEERERRGEVVEMTRERFEAIRRNTINDIRFDRPGSDSVKL